METKKYFPMYQSIIETGTITDQEINQLVNILQYPIFSKYNLESKPGVMDTLTASLIIIKWINDHKFESGTAKNNMTKEVNTLHEFGKALKRKGKKFKITYGAKSYLINDSYFAELIRSKLFETLRPFADMLDPLENEVMKLPEPERKPKSEKKAMLRNTAIGIMNFLTDIGMNNENDRKHFAGLLIGIVLKYWDPPEANQRRFYKNKFRNLYKAAI